jgi:hypothetical protein
LKIINNKNGYLFNTNDRLDLVADYLIRMKLKFLIRLDSIELTKPLVEKLFEEAYSRFKQNESSVGSVSEETIQSEISEEVVNKA